MTLEDKRKLRQTIKKEVMNAILKSTYNDEEYFLGLLYASQEIALALNKFDDIFDGKEKNK